MGGRGTGREGKGRRMGKEGERKEWEGRYGGKEWGMGLSNQWQTAINQ